MSDSRLALVTGATGQQGGGGRTSTSRERLPRARNGAQHRIRTLEAP